MTYQEFKENVTTVIQNRLGSNVKVTIQEIIKNNDTHYDGLTILSNQLNISPTIYLNFYFKQYLKGRSLEEICHDILSVYEENKPSGNIDISFFTNYEQVKNVLCLNLSIMNRIKICCKNPSHKNIRSRHHLQLSCRC